MNWKFWKRDESLPSPERPDWDRALINRLVLEYLRDQRRRRRWGTFFKVLLVLYLLGLLVAAGSSRFGELVKTTEPHVAVIDINGVIAPDADASAENINQALGNAFKAGGVQGLILRINSPGGSPVQAGRINDEIQRLKAEYRDTHGRDLPVYAVAADLCASGAYYIAVAADQIFVDKASLVGSIGVRLDGFGFEEAMKNLGIERRLLTAGENKAILDPFSPLRPSQRTFVEGVLNTLHQQFIEVVKQGRGERLKAADEQQLFSGLFWSGEEAVALGLVDGLASASQVAREQIGNEVMVDYTTRRDLFERFATGMGSDFAAAVLRGLDRLGSPGLSY